MCGAINLAREGQVGQRLAMLINQHCNMVNWNRDDHMFLKQLDDVIAQQETLDLHNAYELQQQQLEQSVWWGWMQAMRDGALPLPSDWKDPQYANPYLKRDANCFVRTDAPCEDPLEHCMPTLAALKRVCAAIHVLYSYLDANADTSSAWTYSWRADNANWTAHNHFAGITFIASNEKMIQKAVELVVLLGGKLDNPESLTPVELTFVQSWIVAREMLAKLDELNTHAPYWPELHHRYGEWAEPQSDPYKM